MIYYNKAVRDKIPDIIKKDGYSCSVKTLSDEVFLAEYCLGKQKEFRTNLQFYRLSLKFKRKLHPSCQTLIYKFNKLLIKK